MTITQVNIGTIQMVVCHCVPTPYCTILRPRHNRFSIFAHRHTCHPVLMPSQRITYTHGHRSAQSITEGRLESHEVLKGIRDVEQLLEQGMDIRLCVSNEFKRVLESFQEAQNAISITLEIVRRTAQLAKELYGTHQRTHEAG